MKRTDLIALVKRVEGMKLPPGYNAEAVAQLAEFARQIAQAQPVRGAVFGMYGVERINLVADGSEREWVDKCGGSLLYTLPLED